LVIGDDPKFKQIFMQGICSLEIRKPGNFDGGVYACRAKNSHGEATVVCHLEVKRKRALLPAQVTAEHKVRLYDLIDITIYRMLLSHLYQ